MKGHLFFFERRRRCCGVAYAKMEGNEKWETNARYLV